MTEIAALELFQGIARGGVDRLLRSLSRAPVLAPLVVVGRTTAGGEGALLP